MSFTYTGDPENSTLEKTRFLLQDTDSDTAELTDAEINSLLTDNGSNAVRAAIAGCEILIAKYSRKADRSLGDLSISYSQISSNYQKLLGVLRTRAAMSIFTPYAGGISISDKQSYESTSDRTAPAFKVGMHDFDGTVTEQTDESD